MGGEWEGWGGRWGGVGGVGGGGMGGGGRSGEGEAGENYILVRVILVRGLGRGMRTNILSTIVAEPRKFQGVPATGESV